MHDPAPEPADGPSPQPRREPALNVPGPLLAIIALLVVIHAALTLGPFEWLHGALVHGAFIPARLVRPDGGWEAWTMWLSYAFLHGSWGHVLLNTLWMVVFGTPVIQRLGTARFLALCAAGAIGAVALHVALHWGDTRPLIGASGVVSALTGAAARFAFQPRARLRPQAVPRLTLPQTFANPTALSFIAVWMVANVLFGAGLATADGPSIAWEAHIGGFLVGLFAFGAFDQPSKRSVRAAGSIER